MGGKALGKGVGLEKIARRTPGFTGADLQNLMNEAAILAARREVNEISNDEIEDALERIVAGPEKKGTIITQKKKQLVAYHEAGHALVGVLMPEYDPVTKVTIVPRGRAGGITFFAPSEERLESGLYSRSYLENQLSVALGGRVAEELIFGPDNVTTGAGGDFQQVTRIARMMVSQMGFNRELGPVSWSSRTGPSFLGQAVGQGGEYSQETADVIDEEVKKLVERAYRRAKDLIQSNISILHSTANVLIERETIDGEELLQIIQECNAAQYLKKDAPDISLPYQTDTTTI